MISEREKYETFENYLKGSLDKVSKDALEDALRKDPVLNREFEEYREAHYIIFESSLLDIQQEIETMHSAKLKSGRTWKGVRNILISAGVVLTGVSLYMLLNRSGETYPEEDHLSDLSIASEQTNDGEHEESLPVRMQDKNDKAEFHQIPATADTNGQVADLNFKNKDAGTDKKMRKPEEGILKLLNKDVDEKFELPVAIPPVDTLLTSENNQTGNKINDLPTPSDCEKVIISCEYIAESTCSGKSQGRILFITQSLRGGTPPYEFSINGGKAFETQTMFDKLQSGQYRLFVRDAHQCISETGLAKVDNVECDFRFAPGLGEVWEIPFITDKEGKLNLYSKEGKLLYSSPVGPYIGKTWDGRSLQGEMMPLGVYMFQLSFKDGSLYQGTVTIIK